MKKIAKKFSALLLTLALVLTMMPFAAAESFAAEGDGDTVAYTVNLNGNRVGGVSLSWMVENTYKPQIFPSITKKGVGYVIAQGPTIDDVLDYAFGIGGAEAIPDAMISVMPTKKNPISGKDLADAVTITKPVDEKGQDIDFLGANNAFVDKIAGSQDVIPVIAYLESKKYDTYEEASEALAAGDNEWVADENIQPYVGGNLKKDLQIKKDGTPLDASVNFTGKFVITDGEGINVALTAPTEAVKEDISMMVGDPAYAIDAALTTQEISLLYGEDYVLGWEISEGEGTVIKFSSDDSTDIVAVGAGKGVVKASVYIPGDETAEPIVINEWNFTVEAKAPAISDGQIANVGGNTYQVVSANAKTAAFNKAANKKSATVPATVVINGVTLKVTGISPYAFKGTKVKTVTVKTKNLKKATVKKSLKGSKVKTVKVKVGKKKDNKKYVKKYKKIFTKKNAGKKVTVK